MLNRVLMKLEAKLVGLVGIEAQNKNSEGDLTCAGCRKSQQPPTEWCGG